VVISKINHQFMNVPDPDEKILHDLNLLLYDFLFDGKNDKITVSVVCQDPAAGGLKMVDVKSFLSVLKIGWLKRILCDKRENSKILQKMCAPLKHYFFFNHAESICRGAVWGMREAGWKHG